MIKHWTNITIRYGETDQMGYVHHSNYALYLEQARMDLFSSYGLDILALEKEGVILPLVHMEIRYLEPLHFGDQISVETRLNTGNKIKLELNYRIFKQNHKLVVRAKTALVFADKDSGKLIPGAHQYLEALTFQEEQSSS